MIFLDFEYRDSRNKHPDLVSACIIHDSDKPETFWLWHNDRTKGLLTELLTRYQGDTIVSYSVAAEARCLQALGINPLKYHWYDPMVAMRAIRNSPTAAPGYSMIDCCRAYEVPYSHFEQKDLLRDLILTNKDFSGDEIKKICYYCYDDTRCLSELFRKTLADFVTTYSIPEDRALLRLINWSRYSISMGMCETVGTPVDVDRLNNLAHNYKLCKNYYAEQISYPFYRWDHCKDEYAFSHKIFEEFLKENNLDTEWARTPGDSFSLKKDVLKDLSYLHPHLKSLSTYKPIIDSLRYYSKDEPLIFKAIGDDNRIRTGFMPYGTITGRNAPPASKFLPAQPSVFRSLIRPPDGYSITSIDWAAQEFVLGALISEDEQMLEAYNSGDPYVYFGKAAGAIPNDGTKESHKAERNLFKATVLGLQYSMGKKKLTAKLCHDTGTQVSVSEAEQLITLHKKIFGKYWKWIAQTDSACSRRKVLHAVDGYPCHSDREHITSLRNFPIQGSGASVLRRATVKACSAGLSVIFPLHDAIYIIHRNGSNEHIDLLSKCMSDAVSDFFPGATIRQEIETHTHADVWLEDRAKDIYAKMMPFLDTRDPEVDVQNKVHPKLSLYNLFEEAI